ncbi:prolyl oligopeptidase family serine peptidase [Verrucomicrobia bacterium]|nr:prolyl oligopeptidase family serine peptidase [Verrucomicrobiota bacterium]MDG1891840.1 prolyl oligopeptidase family serine peptidase [Verrucomicrobiota bacterium]
MQPTRKYSISLCWLGFWVWPFTIAFAADSSIDRELSAYFEKEVGQLEARTRGIMDASTPGDWKGQQPELRRQLAEMLGLDPMPGRTPMLPVVSKRMDKGDYVVENLHFQSLPGLYVTGNLYLPRDVVEPLPAILYVSGHAHAKEGGVSYGNKTAYQHHGIWFARHGFVCLIIDTIQLGEIEGMHHGTYRYHRWWWNSRGYTPAGVEAWNGIRALDYLQSRSEVDAQRLGITGRSGGGVYSWWVAALDERVKVVVPVAGITDLRNYVLDGAVEGHCDCMFMVNRYRWDYPMIAALVAPRPLLIANSDKDAIFPLDGVLRTHAQVRKVYALLGASDRLGLLITEGPHKDTQDLQVPAFRWFRRWLMDIREPVEGVATKEITPVQLKVFDVLPGDEKVTSIDEHFVPRARPGQVPASIMAWDRQVVHLSAVLRREVFGAWPELSVAREDPQYALDPRLTETQWLHPQPSVKTALRFISPDLLDDMPIRVAFTAGDTNDVMEGGDTVRDPGLVIVSTRDASFPFRDLKEHKRNQIRRRFMLVGQTLDGMRVFDLVHAMKALLAEPSLKDRVFEIEAEGDLAVNALYAGLMLEQDTLAVSRLKFRLAKLPASHMNGPDYLNIMKVTRLDESLAALSRRFEVQLMHCPEALMTYAHALRERLGKDACRLTLKVPDQ